MRIDRFPDFDPGKFLPGTRIEIRREIESATIRSALFDFDGTISLIRTGWQQVMVEMMVGILIQYPGEGETLEQLTSNVREYVDRFTGKQTIYQMVRLAEEIRQRGGVPADPLEYKEMYNEYLLHHIRCRLKGLRQRRVTPDELMMPHARALLKDMRKRGIVLYLASGTDLVYIQEEAELLGVAKYFNGGIYGALDRVEDFSKAAVIQQIFRERRIQGRELVSFGDGFVEILNTKEVDGTAVGVASDEVGKQAVNEWKRNRLIQAGADLIIPGYSERQPLLNYLFRTNCA